jgi:hypothetical protein
MGSRGSKKFKVSTFIKSASMARNAQGLPRYCVDCWADLRGTANHYRCPRCNRHEAPGAYLPSIPPNRYQAGERHVVITDGSRFILWVGDPDRIPVGWWRS